MKNLIYILLISLTLQSCSDNEYSKRDIIGDWSNDKISLTFTQRKVYFNGDEKRTFKYEFDNGFGYVKFDQHNQEFELLSYDFMKYGEYFLNKK